MKQAKGLWDDTYPAVAYLMLLYVNIEQMLWRSCRSYVSLAKRCFVLFFCCAFNVFSLAGELNACLYFQLALLLHISPPHILSTLSLLSTGTMNSIGCWLLGWHLQPQAAVFSYRNGATGTNWNTISPALSKT